jgi:hypothetical protein
VRRGGGPVRAERSIDEKSGSRGRGDRSRRLESKVRRESRRVSKTRLKMIRPIIRSMSHRPVPWISGRTESERGAITRRIELGRGGSRRRETSRAADEPGRGRRERSIPIGFEIAQEALPPPRLTRRSGCQQS